MEGESRCYIPSDTEEPNIKKPRKKYMTDNKKHFLVCSWF